MAVDIGGTFTDVALDNEGKRITAKVLTTTADPSAGVLAGISQVMSEAALEPSAVGIIIHGTTLATNALIQRRGARTALITTAGHRDALEMAYENRFEQYDINIDRPAPLVPRYLRLPVTERMNRDGEILIPLDEDTVRATLPLLAEHDVESVAIGLLHAYANPEHEQRIQQIIASERPDLSITLASAVCPEIREFDRLSTACANAFVRPLMASYLHKLDDELKASGFACPFLLMTSGGGLTTVETAAEYPIRLVESGPAGGAILACEVARECDLDAVVSYDMGGTTAKICLIDEAEPLMSRTFEVGRAYRFKKGSGIPLRIPVIEMVEIGAGGGSIASVDKLQRIQVGPDSAGSEPGAAAYGRGGDRPTVTDGDVLLGRIDPDHFAGGSIPLDMAASSAAMRRHVGDPMKLAETHAAFGVVEVVDENMTSAARTHAAEWGKDLGRRDMVAFGGAAPLHAARLAEKLNLDRIVIPTGAGVGSAIGFLLAPVAYEVVRSRYLRLSAFNAGLINDVFEEMRAEALAVVRQGAPGSELSESRQAFMRYVGQGHEVAVEVPFTSASAADVESLQRAFDSTYTALYGRVIPGVDVEVLSWTLTLRAPAHPSSGSPTAQTEETTPATPDVTRDVFDPARAKALPTPVYRRDTLTPGVQIEGPALIVENQTTTVVTSLFHASIDTHGYIVMTRKEPSS